MGDIAAAIDGAGHIHVAYNSHGDLRYVTDDPQFETCCSLGACSSSPGCDDGNPCTADSCDPGMGCEHDIAADNGGCNDGACDHGICAPEWLDISAAAGLAVGDEFVVGIDSDGQTRVWGGTSTIEPGVANVPPAVGFAAAINHVCVLSTAGAVWCWGIGFSGELGNMDTDSWASTWDPVRVPGFEGVVQIAATYSRTFALKADQTIWSWGADFDGDDIAFPVLIYGVSDAVAIAASYEDLCYVSSDGGVSCRPTYEWVFGSWTTQDLPPAIAISAGGCHMCALDALQHVRCWGCNDSLQLGTDVPGDAPVLVEGIEAASAIAAGDRMTCVLLGTKDVVCWGCGQPPTPVPLPGQVVAIAGSTSSFDSEPDVCALVEDGTLWCWTELAPPVPTQLPSP